MRKDLKVKKSIAIIIIIGLKSWLILSCQITYLDRLDKEIAKSFKTRFTFEYEKKDSITHLLEKKIISLLKDPSSFDFPFDSLSAEIKILRSTNNKLKIYSWDELGIGTCHDMSVYAQYKNESGQVLFQRLDSADSDLSAYCTESIITKIYTITIENKISYLTIGWGTYGGGQQHSIIQIFRISGNKLVKCEDCFVNPDQRISTNDLVIVAPRTKEINLKFNPITQEITYNEFLDGGKNEGFYFPTGGVVTLKLLNGKFRKISNGVLKLHNKYRYD